jgi:uncharacterized repeat protein (TIGR01451 family)
MLLLAVPAIGTGLLPDLGAVALVIGVGIVALWVAVTHVFDSEELTVAVPNPETRPTYRQPGADFAELIDAVSLVGRRKLTSDWKPESTTETPREHLRETLQELAVGILAMTDGWPRETAIDRLDDGTWTDDDQATSFFSEGFCPPVSRLAYFPVGDTDLPYAKRARHVVSELSERVWGCAPDPNSTVNDESTPASRPYWPTGEFPRSRSTGLTTDLTAAVLAVSTLGIVFGRPAAVLTATLGIALVGAARIWSPTPTVALSRSLSTDSPVVGEQVTVTVTIRNVGETTLPDIRLVDGVDPGLSVFEGSPRFTTALRPGKATTVSYTVAAVEGHHTFEPGLVIVGDSFGARETITTIEPTAGPTVLDCGFERPGTTAEPPRPQVSIHPGQRVGDKSGAGVEFDALREYRPGDPPARIDWNHRAKTGELSTVQFQEPRLSQVAIIIDTRPEAYIASDTDAIPGPRHCAIAGFTIASRLLADGVPVGFGTTMSPDHWLQPAVGPEQTGALRERFATDDAIPWLPPDDHPSVSETVAAFTTRLDQDVQVVFVSPCSDDEAIEIAHTLDIEGHSVSVVSPDCTNDDTVVGAYGRLNRVLRVSTLRQVGIPVTNWNPEDEIAEVTLHATN